MTRHALAAVFLLSILFVSGGSHVMAGAELQFDPESSEVEVDDTFSVDINIDAGSDQIAATDVILTFDPDLLSLQSVTGGDYFPMVSNQPETGGLYIAAHIVNQGEYKTGTGTVATLIFKALKEGTTDVKFTCDLTQSRTSKINKNDLNATNVIDCSALNMHNVVIGAGDSGANSTSTNKTSTLPESGVIDDMLRYAGFGSILLGLGLGLRIFGRAA